MPTLDAKNLPEHPGVKGVETIRHTLENATGVGTAKLNRAVVIGTDSILKDATEQRTLEKNAPYIAISYAIAPMTMTSSGGVVLFSKVSLSLYFVYYVGKPGGGILPVDFTALRERHIRANLNWLKDKHILPATSVGIPVSDRLDSAGSMYWWWPDGDQSLTVDHDTPLKLFGIDIPIPASSGFACSRVDLAFMAKNFATFN